MDWWLSLLTIVLTPLVTLVGIIISENAGIKKKKLDIDSSNTAKKIDDLNAKVDRQGETITEISSKHQTLATMIEVLSDRVEKHNNVIDRTYALESDVKLIKAEIQNLKA